MDPVLLHPCAFSTGTAMDHGATAITVVLLVVLYAFGLSGRKFDDTTPFFPAAFDFARGSCFQKVQWESILKEVGVAMECFQFSPLTLLPFLYSQAASLSSSSSLSSQNAFHVLIHPSLPSSAPPSAKRPLSLLPSPPHPPLFPSPSFPSSCACAPRTRLHCSTSLSAAQ